MTERWEDYVRRRTQGIPAELVARREVEPRSFVGRGPRGTWLVHTPGEWLFHLDARLRELRRFKMPSRCFGTHDVSPDGDLAYLSLSGSVRCVTAAGESVWEVTHPPWNYKETSSGSVIAARDGRHVWAMVPKPGSHDEWWRIDARTGEVVASATLEFHAFASARLSSPESDEIAATVVHPDGATRAFRVVDPARTTAARFGGEIAQVLDLHPDGTKLVGRRGDDLVLAAHADGPELARRAPLGIFPDIQEYPGGMDRFGQTALFVTSERVVVRSEREGSLAVLSAKDLELLGPLEFRNGWGGSPAATDGLGRFISYDGSRNLSLWALGA